MLKWGYNVKRKELCWIACICCWFGGNKVISGLPAQGAHDHGHRGPHPVLVYRSCSNQQPPEQSFGKCRTQFCPWNTIWIHIKKLIIPIKGKGHKIDLFNTSSFFLCENFVTSGKLDSLPRAEALQGILCTLALCGFPGHHFNTSQIRLYGHSSIINPLQSSYKNYKLHVAR